MPTADRQSDAPLLGRDEEWKSIVRAADLVRGGASRAIVVYGEAGIGKTRLVRELISYVEQTGFAIVSGRAEDLEQMRPFGAIADAVTTFVRLCGAKGTRLEEHLKDPTASSDAAELVDNFVEFVEELALSQPTCVVLEDLHWADAWTIAAARALNRRLTYQLAG